MRTKKFFCLLLSGVLAFILLFGCSSTATVGSKTKSVVGAKKPYNIAVIIKATDSDYWQTLVKGAQAAQKKNPADIKITVYGPPSESDIDKQVSILENVISQKPDAIVIASTSSDATVPAIKKAASQGIPVITCDNQVHTDVVKSFLRTDNVKAGRYAAQTMVNAWKTTNINPENKKVIVISSMAGVQVLIDRDNGFKEEIKKLVPSIKIMQTQYVNNDVSKALATSENVIAANKDLIGIFADNNHSGDGVARAIIEKKCQNSVFGVSFDTDEEEINAVKSGALKGTVVQDPWLMGNQGVQYAVQCIEGKSIPAVVDTGATVVTKKNISEDKVAKLLDPSKRS